MVGNIINTYFEIGNNINYIDLLFHEHNFTNFNFKIGSNINNLDRLLYNCNGFNQNIYLNNVKVKQQIDELPKDNLGALELLMNLSKPYDKDSLEEILHSRRFHKLDWRHNITDANSMFAHLL